MLSKISFLQIHNWIQSKRNYIRAFAVFALALLRKQCNKSCYLQFHERYSFFTQDSKFDKLNQYFIFLPGKFRREFRHVLERGHCLKYNRRSRCPQRHPSDYRSQRVTKENDDSMIYSTTHMVHLQLSLKKKNGQVRSGLWSTQY